MPYIDEKILLTEEEPEKISGVVEHITYRSEESGYTVLTISQDAKDGGRTIDVSCGRRTRSVIITDSEHVILSAIQTETITNRILGGNDADESEDEEE